MAQGGYPWVEGTSPSSSTQKGFWGGGTFVSQEGTLRAKLVKTTTKSLKKSSFNNTESLIMASDIFSVERFVDTLRRIQKKQQKKQVQAILAPF